MTPESTLTTILIVCGFVSYLFMPPLNLDAKQRSYRKAFLCLINAGVLIPCGIAALHLKQTPISNEVMILGALFIGLGLSLAISAIASVLYWTPKI